MNNFLRSNKILNSNLLRSKKFFSQKIYRHITPKNSQEYHDKKEFENYKDNLHFNARRPTSNIFATTPLFPDDRKPIDLMDEQNIYENEHMFKHQKFLKNRENDLKTLIKKKMKTTKYNYIKTGFGNREDLIKQLKNDDNADFTKEIQAMKDEIEKKFITTEEEKTLENNVNELTNKLGILDLRQFIAINKFIVEAEQHEDIISRIKSKFLNIALERMDEIKAQSNIERDPNVSHNDRENEKINELFKNDENTKELFYRFYYKIKEDIQKEEQISNNAEQKYEKMLKNLAQKQYAEHWYDDKVFEMDHDQFETQFEDYTDYIIKRYREERTKKLKVTKEDIEKEVERIGHDTLDSWYGMERYFKLVKYYTFFKKYKKIYIPTNIEYKYQRDKKLKEFNEHMVYQEKDDYFSEVSDDPEYLGKYAVSGLKTKKDLMIHDEESKKRIMEYDNMKKQYYKAKYLAKREEYAKKLDEEISKELGVILTGEMFDMGKVATDLHNPGVDGVYDTKDNERASVQRRMSRGGNYEFLDNLIDNYYAEAKLDYMYQFEDYFSDKYKIRKRITEEMGKKVSLKEINQLLNKMVSEMRREYNDDLLKLPEYRYLNKDLTNHDFNIFNTVKEDYGEVAPDIYDDDQTATMLPQPNYLDIRGIKEKIENEERDPPDLEENDLYEIEAFKTYKNDPVFKHYLYNHLSFFSEKLNDNFSTLPFTMKGIKPQDYVRYEKIKLAEFNRNNKIKASQELARNADNTVSRYSSNNNNVSSNNINEEVIPVAEQKKLKKPVVRYTGWGKRKRSQAIADVFPNGSGRITINKKPFHFYFANPVHRSKVMMPIVLADKMATVDINIRTVGGGVTGQLDAIIPALARAFLKMNPDLKSIYKKTYCLLHDPRNVERKHPGRIKARKGYVFNKR